MPEMSGASSIVVVDVVRFFKSMLEAISGGTFVWAQGWGRLGAGEGCFA
jgi:hypothetical protein